MTNDCAFILFLNIGHIYFHVCYPINFSNTFSKVKSNKRNYMLFLSLWVIFGDNIIIAIILFYLTLYIPTTPLVPTFNFPTTYNVLHDTN